MPSTAEEWKIVSSDFESKWNFSHCIGAIDGKHIAIEKPPDSGSLYYNYKKFFSIILFGVVNANYEFMYVHVGTNGCVSDSSVLQKTQFNEKLIEDKLNLPNPSPLTNSNITVPYVFVGDSAFALDNNIMKPFPFKNISHDKRIFNYRLSRARRVVENAFGILSARFRIFRRAISIDINNVDIIVLACCALHNYLSTNNRKYINKRSLDIENVPESSFEPANWRKKTDNKNIEWQETHPLVSLRPLKKNQRNEQGTQVRQSFTNYFNNEGVVSFQERMMSVVPQ